MNEEEGMMNARNAFERRHMKATLIQHSNRYTIIDWRREDGSGEYYCNFIVDKKRGSIIISGDLGDCIATWYNELKVKDLAHYMRNTGYWTGKIQCSSNLYEIDSDDWMEDFKDWYKDWFEDGDWLDEIVRHENPNLDLTEEDNLSEERDYQLEEFKDELEKSIISTESGDIFYPTDRMSELMDIIDPDWYENSFGRRYNLRIYLWGEGFYMACRQLDFVE